MMPFIVRGNCKMINYIQYLGMPQKVGIAIVVFFLCSQVIGELLEFKGKVVPEIIKIRKYFARKKTERETLRLMPEALANVQKTLDDFNSHYSKDRIDMRDAWIKNVNHKLEENDKCIKEVNQKLDKNNSDTLSLLIESKRSSIINFASYVADERKPVTREQFRRIFKTHDEYEQILKDNNMTNGETDTAMHIINDSYENHTRHHSFIEDVRGYDIKK